MIPAAAPMKPEAPGRRLPQRYPRQAGPGAAPADIAEGKRREQLLAGIIASAMEAIVAIDLCASRRGYA